MRVVEEPIGDGVRDGPSPSSTTPVEATVCADDVTSSPPVPRALPRFWPATATGPARVSESQGCDAGEQIMHIDVAGITGKDHARVYTVMLGAPVGVSLIV